MIKSENSWNFKTASLNKKFIGSYKKDRSFYVLMKLQNSVRYSKMYGSLLQFPAST